MQSYLKYLDVPLVELLKNSDLPLYALSQPSLYLGHESIADINENICTLLLEDTAKYFPSIEISKEYSTPKSNVFINGILDSIAKDFIKSGKIIKEGRGLQE